MTSGWRTPAAASPQLHPQSLLDLAHIEGPVVPEHRVNEVRRQGHRVRPLARDLAEERRDEEPQVVDAVDVPVIAAGGVADIAPALASIAA